MFSAKSSTYSVLRAVKHKFNAESGEKDAEVAEIALIFI